MDKFRLFNYCRTSLDKDTLIFDDILDIHEILMDFLYRNKLELKNEDEKIFLIKLVEFIYNNSKIDNNHLRTR